MSTNRIVLIIALATFIASCSTRDNKNLIVGKWQAVSLENPELDKVMADQKNFLDTFGTSTNDEENLIIYGFSNVDSARDAVKQEMDEYLAMQDHAVKNTSFEFRKDGWVVRNFTGQVDSTKWNINDEGVLVLEEENDADTPHSVSMDILSLTDTMLKLRLTEQGMSSTVIFKPAGKE